MSKSCQYKGNKRNITIKAFINDLKLAESIGELFNNSLWLAKYGEPSAKNKLREIKSKLNIDDSIITEKEIIKSINQRDDLVHIKKGNTATVDVKELHLLTTKLYKFFKYSVLSYMWFLEKI